MIVRNIALSVVALAAAALFASANYSIAQERPIKIFRLGKDTQSIHLPVGDRTLRVYAPHEDFVKRAVQLMSSVLGEKRQRSYQLLFAELRNVDNAFAMVHRGQRYILYDADMWARVGNMLSETILVGHELGHHVCGHVGGWVGHLWDRELEADRFAGAAVRAYLADGFGDPSQAVTHDAMLAAASDLLARFPHSGSHPPIDARLKAFSDGWRNGAPCLEKLR